MRPSLGRDDPYVRLELRLRCDEEADLECVGKGSRRDITSGGRPARVEHEMATDFGHVLRTPSNGWEVDRLYD